MDIETKASFTADDTTVKLEKIEEPENQNSDTVTIERAGAYLSKHFGSDNKWAELNVAIWTIIKSTPDYALHLSDLNVLIESTSCDGDEILSVLALFSRPSVRLLKLELRSEKHNGVEVKMADFINKLKDWWKRKAISEEDWRRWSSDIKVRWISISKMKYIPFWNFEDARACFEAATKAKILKDE